jgi:penicillin amidase
VDEAAGAGHRGVPGIWWGSNGDVAWGLTNNGASTRDLYVEQVHPEDPGRYRDGETWRAFEERRVTIGVRGAESVQATIRTTVRGPVANDNGLLPAVDAAGDPPLSLRWVGQEHIDDVRALVAIGRARTWPAFRAALRDWAVPVFNFGFAGRDGRVGYQCAGRIPLRGRTVRGFREAGRADDAWQGYVPFDALPRQDDPPRGYVASANNRVAEDDFPYPLYGAWAAGHRATRLGQHLGGLGGRQETRADTAGLQLDVKSARAERLCPPLVRRLAASKDGAARLLRDLLEGWDYRYERESAAALAFESI